MFRVLASLNAVGCVGIALLLLPLAVELSAAQQRAAWLIAWLICGWLIGVLLTGVLVELRRASSDPLTLALAWPLVLYALATAARPRADDEVQR